MARPRRDSATVSARRRIEAAFWELLAERPFAQITVAALSKRAGVNHNTFYYHFRSLEDLGCQLIDATVAKAPLEIAIDAFLTRGITARELIETTPAVIPTLERGALIANAGSAALTSHLRETVKARWLGALGLEGEANPDLEFALTFLIGGMLSALGEYGAKGLEGHLPAMLDAGFGAAMVRTLTRLGAP